MYCTCILLWLAVVTTHQHVFTYVKPWDPFRRSLAQYEMCYKGDCIVTDGPRCEYYADASKLISDDDSDDDDKIEDKATRDDDKVDYEVQRGDEKIDTLIFELVDSASSMPQFKGCIPLISQYTDCTEENICIGCKFCSCNEEGSWICSQKQKCRVEPKLNVDHRIIRIVIENLKRKEKPQERRSKRSANTEKISNNKKDKLTYSDISKWMYGVAPLNDNQNIFEVGDILKNLEANETTFDEYKYQVATTVKPGPVVTKDASTNKSDNYLDLLEFNDILESWKNEDISSQKPFTTTDIPKTFPKHRYEGIHYNDVDYSEYDPIRLIKRDTSQLVTNKSPTLLQINTTNNNLTYELIFSDALEGLSKITNEKQKELDELLNIQSNLLTIAKAHNIAIEINSTVEPENAENKHHIAIYKLDTFDECVAKVKHDICSAIADVINSEPVANSSDLQSDLKLIFRTIRKYMVHENVNSKANNISSYEYDHEPRRHIEPDNRYLQLNPIKHMGFILSEINNSPGNPLRSLSQQSRKIIKRVVKKLYLDDFAVIDYIVHETYYDFDSYMENIGTKWNKMMQDVIDSEIFDTLYKVKLLHMTLKSDISKMEDMITLLDFARNRRMTVANGLNIDKSILRIQNNLQLIDNSIQKIMKLEKSKHMIDRHTLTAKRTKPTKKNSIIHKLKKIFQSSKNDIKQMLRKRFPKSEIIKRIAKKKIDELETRKMLDYQETMKQWQENFNDVPRREKRFAWDFKSFADRIKNIIPDYLKGKVKPAIHKKNGSRTQTTRRHDRKKKRHTNPTTIKVTIVSLNSTES